jgi:hypothetical protein
VTKITIPDARTLLGQTREENQRLRYELAIMQAERDEAREERDKVREAYQLPRLTDEQCQDLRIAFVDHDDERDETLAAVIEWYLRARAITAGDKHDMG